MAAKVLKVAVVPAALAAVGLGSIRVYAVSDSQRAELISPRELSIYSADDPAVERVEAERGGLERGVGLVRVGLQPYVRAVKGAVSSVKVTLVSLSRAAQDSYHFLQDPPPGFLPRMGVIGVSGLGGLILARKGSGLKRVTLPLGLSALGTSVCYPAQTVSVLKVSGKKLYSLGSSVASLFTTNPKEDVILSAVELKPSAHISSSESPAEVTPQAEVPLTELLEDAVSGTAEEPLSVAELAAKPEQEPADAASEPVQEPSELSESTVETVPKATPALSVEDVPSSEPSPSDAVALEYEQISEPVEESTSEPSAPEPVVEDVPSSEPSLQEPAVEIPSLEPVVEIPSSEPPPEPAVEIPSLEPVVEIPSSEPPPEPAVEIPSLEPVVEIPSSEPPPEPVVDVPSSEPVVNDGTSSEPSLQEPVVEIPSSEPSSPEPVVEIPSSEPSTPEPVVDVPSSEPVVNDGTSSEPSLQEPVVEIPSSEPSTPEPVVDVPSSEPSIPEPIVVDVSSSEPVVNDGTSSEPSSPEPIVEDVPASDSSPEPVVEEATSIDPSPEPVVEDVPSEPSTPEPVVDVPSSEPAVDVLEPTPDLSEKAPETISHPLEESPSEPAVEVLPDSTVEPTSELKDVQESEFFSDPVEEPSPIAEDVLEATPEITVEPSPIPQSAPLKTDEDVKPSVVPDFTPPEEHLQQTTVKSRFVPDPALLDHGQANPEDADMYSTRS